MPKQNPAKPRAPAVTEPSGEVMFLLGQLVEGQKAANQRMDEITQTQRGQAEVQRQQAASLEELIQENARQYAESAEKQAEQHADTAQKLGALGEGLSDVRRRMDALERDNTPAPKGPSAGRQEKDEPTKGWGTAFTFVKEYWPGLFAIGAVIAGAVATWWKGGHNQP